MYILIAILMTTVTMAVGQPGRCDQTPVGAKTLTPADPKDAPFRFRIDKTGNKFLNDQTYVLVLESTNDGRPFKEFMITVEDPEVDESPAEFEHKADVGTLKTLDEDNKSRYSERCSSSVESADNSDKERIETHWVSPKVSASNQRIRFRAMVAENKEKWYTGEDLTIVLEKDDAISLDSPPYVAHDACNLCSEARYEVIFKGQWSRLTHPNKYPSKPDDNGYTHMVGASHGYEFKLWNTGDKAGPELKDLVENYNTSSMERLIIDSMSEAGGTRTLIRGLRRHHPHMSEPSYSLFRVDRVHHLFSLVVGMRPSPDWFLGTKQFELCTNDGWLSYWKIPLYPFDAGTMNGISYESPKTMTQPQENVDRVAVGSFNKDSPFYQLNLHDIKPFAYLEVRRLAVYPLLDADCSDAGVGTLEAVDDNDQMKDGISVDDNGYDQGGDPQAAESRQKAECEWSPCAPHVGSCGQGLQIRQGQRQTDVGDALDNDKGSASTQGRSSQECLEDGPSFRDCFVDC